MAFIHTVSELAPVRIIPRRPWRCSILKGFKLRTVRLLLRSETNTIPQQSLLIIVATGRVNRQLSQKDFVDIANADASDRWPFSTAHILKSLAAIYRDTNSSITADQYVQSLSIYATTQQKDGAPYVAESHYPFMNSWSADSSNHSEHYDHSTNNDDVITGLLGIVPQSNDTLLVSPIIPSNWTYFAIENVAYHGHLVTVLYDAKGTRYNCGASFCVFADGDSIVKKNVTYPIHELISLEVASTTSEIPVNIAANPNGLGYYPLANATYTYSLDNPYKAIDGALFTMTFRTVSRKFLRSN